MIRDYKRQPVTLDGIEAPLGKWIDDSGLRQSTVWQRLKRGLSPLEALITPDSDGHKLHTRGGLDQISLPCNPIVTIGTVRKSLREWSDLAGLSFEVVTRAVNGGISPIDALTKWCGRQEAFWTCFWEDQIRQYEGDHPVTSFALDDAESIRALYLSVRQHGRLDPLEFYCRQRFTDDATKAAEHYANTTDNWITTTHSETMKDADDGIICFYETIRPVVAQIRESLRPMLNAVLPDHAEFDASNVTSSLYHHTSLYIYRVLKANLDAVTASSPEETTVKEVCEA